MAKTDSASESWRGKVGALAHEEFAAFMSEPHIARLACLDGDGWPYVVPCWHEWDGSGWWVVPREKAAWAHHLKRDPRCAITIDEAGTQRKVIAQCTALLVEQPNVGGAWVPIAERMSERYLGGNGAAYLDPTRDRPRWLFKLHPRELTTWQGNDWARRY